MLGRTDGQIIPHRLQWLLAAPVLLILSNHCPQTKICNHRPQTKICNHRPWCQKQIGMQSVDGLGGRVPPVPRSQLVRLSRISKVVSFSRISQIVRLSNSDRWMALVPKGRHQWKKNVFFRALPEFFGPFSRSAFLVNKKSLFLQKCQCIELLTVF